MNKDLTGKEVSLPEPDSPILDPRVPSPFKALKRNPHILLAASGSVAAIKFPIIARCLSQWAEVKAVCTSSSLKFINKQTMPTEVPLYTDDDEWQGWKKIGDSVLHIELRRWADLLLIAPLSANTLAKCANGMCDNLLTCVVRAWDFDKPFLIAPAMNSFMWNSLFTARHLEVMEDLGAQLVSPIVKKLACGDVGNGAMAEPASIEAAVRHTISKLDSIPSNGRRHSEGNKSG